MDEELDPDEEPSADLVTEPVEGLFENPEPDGRGYGGREWCAAEEEVGLATGAADAPKGPLEPTRLAAIEAEA